MNSYCGDSQLWDPDLLFNSSWPHFSSCFQSNILVFLPNGYLWCAMVVYLPYLFTRPAAPLPHTKANVAKTMLSILLALCTVTAIYSETGFHTDNIPYPTAHYIARFVEGVTYLLAAIVTQLERSKGMITSGVIFIYWLLLSLVDIIPMYSYIILRMAESDLTRMLIFITSYIFIVAELLLQGAIADRPQNYTEEDCPETKATFLSRITFWWMARLIVTGFRKPLDIGTLWRLNPRDQTSTVVPLFEHALEKSKSCNFAKIEKGRHYSSFSDCNGQMSNGCGSIANGSRGGNLKRHASNNDDNDEIAPLLNSEITSVYSSMETKRTTLARARYQEKIQNPRSSLFRVLLHTYWCDVLLSYACKLCSDVLQYLSPLLLGLLIKHVENEADQEWKGYVIAVLMLAVSWSQTSFYHQHYHLAMTLGMRMKIALMAAIYKKSLNLNTEGQRASTVGEVVNLMAVDCQRVQDVMSYTWMIWSIPLQVFLAVYLLWDTLGISVLAGVGLLTLLVPVNGYLAYLQQNFQKENLQWKDKRVKLIHEILSGIKVLKLYAWESSFQEKVLAIRQKEIGILTKVAHINAFSIFIWTCAPYLVTLATFATYVLSDPTARLDANKAFVTLSLFNILQFPISFLPEMIAYTSQACVSIKRIDEFLKLEDLDPGVVIRESTIDAAVRIERGVFTWDRQGRSNLHNITLEIAEGELVAVVGNVGSGKSTLLAAVLGELEKRRGKVFVKGTTAYVPQQAWIQNATLKENIIFGGKFDTKKYKKTLDACALTADLSVLPGGDQTEIGEKGINLSGGQKQRVSLARAVYSEADIYLLDDPLSAVDSHVGKHIFRKVISDKGVLKHKTRVLVTHAVHWLPLVDTIVLMQDGRVVETGSYLQLMRRNGALAQYLHNVLSNSDDTDSDEDPEVSELRKRIMEHVESVTSTSEGGTSGDDVLARESGRFLKSLDHQTPPPPSPATTSPTSLSARLTEEEQTATGTVKLRVFGSYASNVGCFACLVIFLLFASYQMASVYASFWLIRWTDDPILTSPNFTQSDVEDRNHFYLTYYGILGAGQALFISIYAWLAAVRMTRAAANMHATMLDCILRSPMSFFDTTPSGRIVNRFSRDIETIDNTLPQILFMFVMCIFSVLSTLIVISVNTPLFISVILPLVLGYYAIQRFFVPTSRQLKRLEAVTRSPIYSHFSETVSGACVIRAFGVKQRFMQESLQRIDKNQVFYFAGISANRWLGVWIEMVSSCIVFASAVFAILTPNISGGQAGLSVTYALQVTQALKWLVRTISDLETNIVSVERVQEYSDLPSEAPRVTSVRPRLTWPSHGNIIFTNYSTRYRIGLDLVIKGIDINIRGGEKVGIVGRTGAGKSSLTLALFRLIEPASGTITVDGLDTRAIGLQDLRSRLTILPQDPVLFSGSLRMNLDPVGQFTDRELFIALQHAHLMHFVRDLPQGLDYDCGEEGRNLSVGQRQLLCLARGLLRKTRILVLDEPTAAVDMETDILIQGTIRREFTDCTTITIAHRLNTIMDYDRVLVLDEGRVKEFDRPSTLLNDTNSIFYALARDAGLV